MTDASELVSHGLQALLLAYAGIRGSSDVLGVWKRRRAGDEAAVTEYRGQTSLISDLNRAWEVTRNDNKLLGEQLQAAVKELREAAKEIGILQGTINGQTIQIGLLKDQALDNQKTIAALREEINALRRQLNQGATPKGNEP